MIQQISERQQAYQHTGTGLEKASHERMMNGQGRKIVQERVQQQSNVYDHFKNLRREDAKLFD